MISKNNVRKSYEILYYYFMSYDIYYTALLSISYRRMILLIIHQSL